MFHNSGSLASSDYLVTVANIGASLGWIILVVVAHEEPPSTDVRELEGLHEPTKVSTPAHGHFNPADVVSDKYFFGN